MSILNDILQRGFVGDDPNEAMKWFDRERYYKLKEQERKQQELADAQKQADVDAMAAQAQRGSIARDLGLLPDTFSPRRAGEIVDFLGGAEGQKKGFQTRSFLESSPEGQRAMLAEMQSKGYLNVPKDTDVMTTNPDIPSYQGRSERPIMVDGVQMGTEQVPMQRMSNVPPIEAALGSAVNPPTPTPSTSIAEGEPRVEDIQPKQRSAIEKLLTGLAQMKEDADKLAASAPPDTGFGGALGAATSNIKPLDLLQQGGGIVRDYNPVSLMSRVLPTAYGKIGELANEGIQLGSGLYGKTLGHPFFADKLGDVLSPFYYPNYVVGSTDDRRSAEERIKALQNYYDRSKAR